MAINFTLIDQVQYFLKREVAPTNMQLVEEFERCIAIPNYRAAFAVLAKIEKTQSIKKSEEFRTIIGRFWHEVAE